MRAIEQGAFDYLEEPVDRQALHYALQRAMLFRDTHASLREVRALDSDLLAVSRSGASRRPKSATRQPSAKRRWALARPIPLPAPETIAMPGAGFADDGSDAVMRQLPLLK